MDFGKQGETIARNYLIAKGYAIRQQNARIGHLEIDIVAMHGNRIVFVEGSYEKSVIYWK